MLRHGVDFKAVLSHDISRAWNILYSMAVEGLEPKKRADFDSDVFRRPPGEERIVGDSFETNLAAGAAAYAKSLERAQAAIESTGVNSEGG